MKETLGKEFYESADKAITISRPETFEDYLQRLKDRRTEDDYKYIDEDFEKYKDYISDCCKNGMSVYKCLEFMYFAEKDMVDQLFNREPKEEVNECCGAFYGCDKCLQRKESHNFLPGFVKQFDPKEGEIKGWTAVEFLKWLDLNKFKIVK